MPQQPMSKPSEVDLAAQPLTASELGIWSKATATMIGMGVPILETFAVAYEMFPKAGMRALSVDAHDGIREGQDMQGAVKATAHGLPEWGAFLQAVDEGEREGNLDQTLLAFAKGLNAPAETLGWSPDVSRFTQEFGALMKSGQPILRSLRLMTDRFAGPFGDELVAMADAIEGGATLAEALTKHGSSSFDRFYTSVIAAGEAGGVLDIGMERLAEFS